MGVRNKPLRRRRGFVLRLGAAAIPALLGGVFLMMPSVSAEKTAADNHALYSGWQAAPDRQAAVPAAEIKIGSFRLHRPGGETFVGGLSGTVYDVLSAVPPRPDELEHYLQARARARLTTIDEPAQTFGDYLRQRAHGVPQQLLRDSTAYLNDALQRAVNRQTATARFLHNIEVDLQTPLGERRGQGGLSALGALRETDRDAIVWQLRGYVAEESGKGANAGLIYRRATHLGGDALFGGNVFLDLEHHGDSGENFWRWSVGGEYRNAYFDFYANYYFPITDAITREDKLYYTQEGLDVELNADILNSRYGSLAGGLGYYHWQGLRDEPDDSGLRYHLRVSPDSGNLFIELQLDVPEAGSAEWGGRVSYRHFIAGAAASGGRSLLGGESAFDAREYFFDPVRREYAQRIRGIVITDVQAKGLAGAASLWRGGGAAPVMLTPDAAAVVLSRPLTASLALGAGGTVELAQVKAWTATVYQNTTLSLHLGNDGSTLYLDGGSLHLTRRSNPNNLNRLEMYDGNDRVTIDLYGTRCYFTAGLRRRLVCDEGEVRATLSDFNDLVMRYGGSSVTIFVDYPGPDDQDSMRTVALHCDSAESRMHHRELDENFPGCFGDARVNMPAAGGNMVEVVSEGRTLTIERRDIGGEIKTIIKTGRYTLTLAGSDSIPLNPKNLKLLTPPGNTGMVELLVPVGNMSPRIDAAELIPRAQTYQLLGGKDLRLSNGKVVAQSDSPDGNCSPDDEPAPGEPLLSCGDIAFGEVDAEEAFYPIYARTGELKVITLDITGGSGRFSVVLQRRAGNVLLQTETAAPVDDEIVLTLHAAAKGSGEYLLRVAEGHPEHVLADTAAPAEVTIFVSVADSLTAPVQPRPFAAVVARDKDIEIYSGEFMNAVGDLIYEEPVYEPPAYSDLFEVKADRGSSGVTVSLLGAPFLESADVRITIVAADEADGKKATLVVRVQADELGAISYDFLYTQGAQVSYGNVNTPEYNRRHPNMSDKGAVQMRIRINGHRGGVSGGAVTLKNAFFQRDVDGEFFNSSNFRALPLMDDGQPQIAVLIGRLGADISCGDYKFIARLEDEYGQQARIERAFRVVDAQSDAGSCQSSSPTDFSAPLVSGPLLVMTQVPTERQLFAQAFSNARGRIRYDEPTFSSNEGDFIVQATDGSDRVVIRNRGNEASFGNPVPLHERPFLNEANITISLVATDDFDGSKATLVLTVHARDPDARGVRFTPQGSHYGRALVTGGHTWYIYRGEALHRGSRGRLANAHVLGLLSHPLFKRRDNIGFGTTRRAGFEIDLNGHLNYWGDNAPASRDIVRTVNIRLSHDRVKTVRATVRIRIENPDIPPFVAPRASAPLTVITQVGKARDLFSAAFGRAQGRIIYGAPVFSGHGENFAVRSSGNRVVIRTHGGGRAAIQDETDVTIRLVATDSANGRSATLAVTVHARDPDDAGLIFTPARDGGFLRRVVEDGHTVYVYSAASASRSLGWFSTPLFEGRPGVGYVPLRKAGLEGRSSGQLLKINLVPPPSRDIQLGNILVLDHSRVAKVTTGITIRMENPAIPPFAATRPAGPLTVYTQVGKLIDPLITLRFNPHSRIRYAEPVFSSHARGFYLERITGANNRVIVRTSSRGGLEDEMDITIRLVATDDVGSHSGDIIFDRKATMFITIHVRDPGEEVFAFTPGAGFIKTVVQHGVTFHVYRNTSIRKVLGQFSNRGIEGAEFVRTAGGAYVINESGVFRYTGVITPEANNTVVLEHRIRLPRAHTRLGRELRTTIRLLLCDDCSNI